MARSGGQHEAAHQLDVVLIWTFPLRPQCPCVAAVRAEQLGTVLELQNCLDSGLFGVDLNRC